MKIAIACCAMLMCEHQKGHVVRAQVQACKLSSGVVMDGERFTLSKESILWVRQQIDGLTLADPCKRSHLSAACLVTSIEHGIAILVLIDEGLHGSALALVR